MYSNGSTFSIYYNVRVKGHFENSWTELYPTIQLLPHTGDYNINNFQQYEAPYIWGENTGNHPILPQSNTSYTIASIPANYPIGGQVDIQVEAMLGVNSTYFLSTDNFFAMGDNYLPAIAYVTSSDWSNTQTVTISQTSPTSTSTPAVPEFPALIILPLFAVMILLSIVFVRKRIQKNR